MPLFGAGAFKKVFGRSTAELWQEFRDERERGPVSHSETDAHAHRLTHDGFVVTAPRVAADGTIYYAIADADGFPALMALPPRSVAGRIAGRGPRHPAA